MGRSRGDFSIKIYMTVDGLSNPLNSIRLQQTAGQRQDIIKAWELVEGLSFKHILADRGFAAQAFYDWIIAQGMTSVIPPHRRATDPLEYDSGCTANVI